MPHDLGLLRPGLVLEIETADYGTDIGQLHSVAVYHTGLTAFFEQVAHGSAERLTCYDLCYHLFTVPKLKSYRLK